MLKGKVSVERDSKGESVQGRASKACNDLWSNDRKGLMCVVCVRWSTPHFSPLPPHGEAALSLCRSGSSPPSPSCPLASPPFPHTFPLPPPPSSSRASSGAVRPGDISRTVSPSPLPPLSSSLTPSLCRVEPRMYLYALTLERGASITHAVHGNFSGKKIQVRAASPLHSPPFRPHSLTHSQLSVSHSPTSFSLSLFLDLSSSPSHTEAR